MQRMMMTASPMCEKKITSSFSKHNSKFEKKFSHETSWRKSWSSFTLNALNPYYFFMEYFHWIYSTLEYAHMFLYMINYYFLKFYISFTQALTINNKSAFDIRFATEVACSLLVITNCSHGNSLHFSHITYM